MGVENPKVLLLLLLFLERERKHGRCAARSRHLVAFTVKRGGAKSYGFLSRCPAVSWFVHGFDRVTGKILYTHMSVCNMGR